MPRLKLSYPGRANFSYVSSIRKRILCLHAGQGNLPSRGTLSTCRGTLLGGLSFFHIKLKRCVPGYSASRGERTALYSKAAFNVNFLW